MTLYLDTSALVKVFLAEAGSASVMAWIETARVLVTSRITYAEARAALARGRRIGLLSASDLRVAVAELDAAFRTHAVVEVTEALVHRAGQLAETHALRGYDAVQLAAALEASCDEDAVVFATFDRALADAALREGLRLPGPADRAEERPAARYGVPRRGRASVGRAVSLRGR